MNILGSKEAIQSASFENTQELTQNRRNTTNAKPTRIFEHRGSVLNKTSANGDPKTVAITERKEEEDNQDYAKIERSSNDDYTELQSGDPLDPRDEPDKHEKVTANLKILENKYDGPDLKQ